jgi:hypothetical protein
MDNISEYNLDNQLHECSSRGQRVTVHNSEHSRGVERPAPSSPFVRSLVVVLLWRFAAEKCVITLLKRLLATRSVLLDHLPKKIELAESSRTNTSVVYQRT